MQRIKKIEKLIENNITDIIYHYRFGKNYKRLVIDKIDNVEYNTTSLQQRAANEMIDILYEIIDKEV